MDRPITLNESTVSPAQYRRFLFTQRRDQLSLATVILWLCLLFLLVIEAGGLYSRPLWASALRWLPLIGGLLAWTLWSLGIHPWLASRSRLARQVYWPYRYTFGEQGLTVRGPDDSIMQRPYRAFTRARWTRDLLILDHDTGFFSLIPIHAIPDGPTRDDLHQLLAAKIIESSPSATPATRQTGLSLSAALWNNLRMGLRLATFQKVDIGRFQINADQLALLALLVLALDAVIGYLTVEKPAEFNSYGLSYGVTAMTAMFFGAYAVARLHRRSGSTLALMLTLLSMDPLFLLLNNLRETLLGTEGYRPQVIASIGIFLWALIAWSRALKLTLSIDKWKNALSLLLIVALAMVPVWYIPEQRYWYAAHQEEGDEEPQLNVEDVFYRQPDMVRQAVENLAPERPGVVDLYHVGFGGYAYQDVFRQEVRHVRDVLDQHLDTKGRSLTLINNNETIDNTPIASRSNLRIALNRLAQRMNTAEDVLFLYLTSHGSKEHELSVDFWPLQLNTINPQELKDLLDEAGIRWRVLVVSACYSGGFIEPLKNDNTLIMTAAAPDKQSFGCDNKSEYTYFGEALFKDALNRTHSIADAFQLAKNTIAERERHERRTPSNPMMVAGDAILEQLEKFEQRIDGERELERIN